MPLTDRFDTTYDAARLESEALTLWETTGIHRYDPDGDGEIFSVDTPPPYVSAAHLHVGHAMSYTQAELLVRFHRMEGRRVFYPMGFDDNGLPTERFVEQRFGLDKRKTTRAEFRALCLDETRRGAGTYRELWRSLGLSVDWSLSYSTIDDRCRRVSQASFLDLYRKGRIYRADQPTLWDPSIESALAQADVEATPKRGTLHTIDFGDGLAIATTRPELLPSCVALYAHPDDPRWQGRTDARVPIAGHVVPVLTDADVRPDFGTGLMMVCTFGDLEDVRRWRRDGLPIRAAIGPDGRMTALAGELAGMTVGKAREAMVAKLKEAGLHLGEAPTEQIVPIAERTGAAAELVVAPQWFVRILDRKAALLARSEQLRWHPAWMKARLDAWITGLQWDWNISRQRYYGVPFPVWFCEDCGAPKLARDEDLPVDPLQDAPPGPCDCGSTRLRGDPDVMDTWMTSSSTPFVHEAVAKPMTLRVQAFEIIRTWLFYSLIKADLHADTVPWRDVMISGWGLNEQGQKISKRDLEKHTDAEGFNRYEPSQVIAKYGADALRWWAANSHLGSDQRYHEKQVRAGRKLAMKLWNAAKFASTWLDEPTSEPGDRPIEDRWLLARIDAVIPIAREGFATYDYAMGLEAIDRCFWGDFCDDWLEISKPRLYDRDVFGGADAAKATLREALRIFLGLYAPYLPFVTEAIWQRLYRSGEPEVSLHVTRYPIAHGLTPITEMEPLLALLGDVRALKTSRRIPQSRGLLWLAVDRPLDGHEATVRAMTRAREIRWGRPLDFEAVEASDDG